MEMTCGLLDPLASLLSVCAGVPQEWTLDLNLYAQAGMKHTKKF